MLYFYKVDQLHRVVDGDTFDVTIDIGFRTKKKLRVRLAEVDTPEIRTREYDAGKVVEEIVRQLLEKNEDNLYIRTNHKGSFGRWISDVYFSKDADITLSEILSRHQLANDGGRWSGKRLKEISRLDQEDIINLVNDLNLEIDSSKDKNDLIKKQLLG